MQADAELATSNRVLHIVNMAADTRPGLDDRHCTGSLQPQASCCHWEMRAYNDDAQYLVSIQNYQ